MPDGFYLLYDPNCYGWEPVWVKDGDFTRCGRKHQDRCTTYMTGKYLWKRIDLPLDPIK